MSLQQEGLDDGPDFLSEEDRGVSALLSRGLCVSVREDVHLSVTARAGSDARFRYAQSRGWNCFLHVSSAC